MRRETSRVSFLMCPFCVRRVVPGLTTQSLCRGPDAGVVSPQAESDFAPMRADGRLSPSTLCIAFPLRAPVRGLSARRIRAGRFASRLRLHAGEVMQLDSGFYAELLDPEERGAAQAPE